MILRPGRQRAAGRRGFGRCTLDRGRTERTQIGNCMVRLSDRMMTIEIRPRFLFRTPCNGCSFTTGFSDVNVRHTCETAPVFLRPQRRHGLPGNPSRFLMQLPKILPQQGQRGRLGHETPMKHHYGACAESLENAHERSCAQAAWAYSENRSKTIKITFQRSVKDILTIFGSDSKQKRIWRRNTL